MTAASQIDPIAILEPKNGARTQEQRPKGRQIRTVGPADLARPLECQPYLVEALGIGPGAPTCFAGYGFGKKSMAGQSLLLDIVTGGPAFGVYRAKQGPVLHLDYEQGLRLTQERYQRLARARGLDLRELPAGSLRLAVFPDVYLTHADAEDSIVRAADGCVAILLDSLRAATPGVDENSSEIRQYVDVLTRVSERTGATVLPIHHARKPSADGPRGARYALRGSSALYDAVASLFVFSAEKGEPTRVEHEKCRNRGILVEDFGLDVEDVPVGNDPRAGIRVVHLEGIQLDDRATPDSSPARNVDRVRAHLRQTGPHHGNRDSLRERLGMGAIPFRNALSVLESTREVRVERDKGGMSIHLVGATP
jgi:hypothetical protein